MKIKVLLVLFSLFFVLGVDAQTRWKRYRWEAMGGIGATNFLGELGGADQIGTDYFKDLELATTRPSLFGGLRYKITPQTAVKATLSWGMVAGDDALTTEIHRSNRNLHFSSHIVELAATYEFYLKKERRGHRFKLRGVKGIKSQGIYPYGFFGIGGFFFNPRAKDQSGTWTSLHRFGTEGQRIGATRSTYSRFQIAIPLGIGLKWAVDRRWLVGIEYGIRKTFTDYIDDVSSTYYPNDEILSEFGNTAAYLADPTEGSWIGSKPFNQRGDPTDNDSYMFLQISVNYKLRTTRGGLPKFR